jgi:hypothetical protein
VILVNRALRESRVSKESRVNLDFKERKETRVIQDLRDHRERQAPEDRKVIKVIRVTRD